MAAFFGPGSRSRAHIKDDVILELIQDGYLSEIEDLDDDDSEFDPNILFRVTAENNISGDENDDEFIVEKSLLAPSTAYSVVQPPPSPSSDCTMIQQPPSPIPRAASRSSRILCRGRSITISNDSMKSTKSTQGRASASIPKARVARKRIWKQAFFSDKPHDYPVLSTNKVRRPIEYFNDYIDTQFLKKISQCTNLYYLRTTGRELKSTGAEIAKLFAIHIFMSCIPYPRVPMYWRAGTKLGLIYELMTRDRFLTLRNALHVVDSDTPAESEKNNPLWKIQPVIDKVKDTCNKLERVPGFYSIDEQMIPFTGRCKLRQVVKNKPRPVGLKNFVLTTSEGLMLDFEIYRGAQTNIGGSNLGLGPSVILHLIKSVPPGSCVYHDRYFTTIPLIEEMEKLNLHSTGTIMQNRIPSQATIKFKKDSQMERGETQQFVCKPTAIVKWKDNKSVLLASNCTAAEVKSNVKRWDKKHKVYVNVSAPKIVSNYNHYMGGVDVLDQYRLPLTID